MGNDGGTILKRKDVINVRASEAAKGQVDAGVLSRVAATQCAISRQPLKTPVVSDALGRLYNKDSVVQYLLARAKDADKQPDPLAGHLRGLRDVRELTLTPNPAYKAEDEATRIDDNDAPTPFVCPLNQRSMNGRHRFVYLVPCGCVMSESGLRATMVDERASGGGDSKHIRKDGAKIHNSGNGTSEGDEKDKKAPCPNCGAPFDANATLGRTEIHPGFDVVIINGTASEVEAQRRAMERARDVEKARKKERKAAAKASGLDVGDDEDARKQAQREEKRKRKEEIARLLEDEKLAQAKRVKLSAEGASKSVNGGKDVSAALRSLYGYDKPQQKESWMTQGTFSRFA